jgi:hypothetical protein
MRKNFPERRLEGLRHDLEAAGHRDGAAARRDHMLDGTGSQLVLQQVKAPLAQLQPRSVPFAEAEEHLLRPAIPRRGLPLQASRARPATQQLLLLVGHHQFAEELLARIRHAGVEGASGAEELEPDGAPEPCLEPFRWQRSRRVGAPVHQHGDVPAEVIRLLRRLAGATGRDDPGRAEDCDRRERAALVLHHARRIGTTEEELP